MTIEGAGGASPSARREHDRRKARDEAKIGSEWGRFGGIGVALTGEKRSTRAWATGAVGEQDVGAQLDGIASEHVRILHDRRIPGSRANIDHIVVTRGAIWVVDTKRYKARPELRVEGGIVRPRVEKMMIRGRDQSKLIGGMSRQIDLVQASVPGVKIRGALCFVDADFLLIGGDFTVRGVDVLWPRKLASNLVASSDGDIDVASKFERLASHFPVA